MLWPCIWLMTFLSVLARSFRKNSSFETTSCYNLRFEILQGMRCGRVKTCNFELFYVTFSSFLSISTENYRVFRRRAGSFLFIFKIKGIEWSALATQNTIQLCHAYSICFSFSHVGLQSLRVFIQRNRPQSLGHSLSRESKTFTSRLITPRDCCIKHPAKGKLCASLSLSLATRPPPEFRYIRARVNVYVPLSKC